MRMIAISFLLFVLLFVESPGSDAERTGPLALEQSGVRPAGTIVPQPPPFSEKPTPVTIRIVNRRATPIYLQGFRGGEERVQIYLYHQEERGGWKPFFEFLPCDLPTCRGLHSAPKSCPKPTPFVVPLGPAGSASSVKEVAWEGLLYQRSEATQEDRNRRYCYKGWVPKTGRMRVEIEFSDTFQNGSEKNGEKNEMIGGRDHAVVEFDLPPDRPSYDVVVEGDSGIGSSPSQSR